MTNEQLDKIEKDWKEILEPEKLDLGFLAFKESIVGKQCYQDVPTLVAEIRRIKAAAEKFADMVARELPITISANMDPIIDKLCTKASELKAIVNLHT